MKAMILCAGLGTRLRPWTLTHPKALVPVAGVPMLKRVALRLAAFGFDELVLNVHHFSSQIVDYVGGGMLDPSKADISDESDALLDTGGGILKAAPMLTGGGLPFLVHNVDILSDADLGALYRGHCASGCDVTLLVSDRHSDRKLIFDSDMRLKGWINQKNKATRPENLQILDSDIALAFSGIYVMSAGVPEKMARHGFSGAFPVMDFFLAGYGDVSIRGVCQNGLNLIDIGKPDTLRLADSMA